MPSVSQPDPPGLMHDDPRLLPPWRGSSSFLGAFITDFCGHLRPIHSVVSIPNLDIGSGSSAAQHRWWRCGGKHRAADRRRRR
ncbi:hypothetical protein DDJ76_18520 [Mycobacteroides abscessus]|nr:hypothetical protein DDJ61_04230 [Mycobacteroides abscessus]PVA77075.1 hypothetical protein DDJ76_18520 [Mycobacteroides abscessus]RIR96176.1 hypothetical protein D2E50_00735 [Mycobacteroides abscessus]RIS05160.1 hypothetical protein D2E63_18780 [Mycobacteroides abscessus]RIS13003.1 hypothetical protein D2E69_20060 [Mycobacteroides abscessus]